MHPCEARSERIRLEKISDIEIIPLKLPTKIIRGKGKPEAMPEAHDRYTNTFIVGKKEQGKTTILWNILKHTVTKKTIVIFFVETIENDISYEMIRSYLDKKGIQHIDENSLDELTEFIDYIKADGKEHKDDAKAADYIVVIDDMSSGLMNNPYINKLVKNNRHLHCKVLISSQSFRDVPKRARSNINYYVIVGVMSNEDLKQIHDELRIDIGLPEFIEMYRKLYDGGHFLTFNVFKNKFYQDLSHKIEL